MTRRGPFKDMFALNVGEALLMTPRDGESVESALKRIKVRASKYRSEGRSFRVTQEGEAIRVCRVPFGKTNKLAEWEAMSAGDLLLLKDRPTPKDITAAKATANYLSSVKVESYGAWRVEIDTDGRLLVRCWEDRNGQMYSPPRSRFSAAKVLTPAERATREASQLRQIAKFNREQGNGTSGAAQKVWWRIADAFEERAREAEERAQELEGNGSELRVSDK